MEVPKLNDAAVPTISGQQGATILTPVEAFQIVTVEHILRLVDAQIVHLDHLIGDCCEPIFVKWVKLYTEDPLVALLFDLRLR